MPLQLQQSDMKKGAFHFMNSQNIKYHFGLIPSPMTSYGEPTLY